MSQYCFQITLVGGAVTGVDFQSITSEDVIAALGFAPGTGDASLGENNSWTGFQTYEAPSNLGENAFPITIVDQNAITKIQIGYRNDVAAYVINGNSVLQIMGLTSLQFGDGRYSINYSTGILQILQGAFKDPFNTNPTQVMVQVSSGQSIPPLGVANSSGTPIGWLDVLGAYHPPTLADSAAQNNSFYFSSTQSKYVIKDSSGTVHVINTTP